MVINIIIFLHWVIFFSLIFIGLYGYKAKILKTLGEYGLDDIEKYMLSNQLKQIQEYKRICVENKLSLNWYNFFLAWPIIVTVLSISFVCLILWTDFIK
jgi:hypothetical protein